MALSDSGGRTRRVSPAGALLVAVGVGVAIAGSPGVAGAEPSGAAGAAGERSSSHAKSSDNKRDSNSDSDATTSPAGSDDTPDSTTDEARPEDAKVTPEDAAELDDETEELEVDEDDEPDATDEELEVDDDEPAPTDDESPIEEPAPIDEGEGDAPAAEEPASKAEDDDTDEQPAAALNDSATPVGPRTEDAAETDVPQSISKSTDDETPSEASTPEGANAEPTMAAVNEIEGQQPSAGLNPVPATETIQTANLTSVVNAVLYPVVSLVGVLLSPFGLGGPADPANPLRSLLEWAYAARSRFQTSFFNRSPTVEPVQLVQVGDVVTGSLNAVDADFDELSYEVIAAPEHGTVVVNTDGTYTYTPDNPSAELTDVFQVRASEVEYRFHGLRDVVTLGGLLNGLFGLPDSGSATATVVVNPIDGPSGSIEVGDRPQGVAVNPDGTLAYVSNSGDNSVSVIDLESGAVIATIADVGNYPTSVVFGTENAYVANLFGNTVTVIDTTDHAVVGSISVGDTPQGLAITDDRLYVTNSGGGSVSVIDIATNTVTATIAVGASPQHIVVHESTGYVTNFDDGTVSVIDTATNTVTATIAVGATPQAVAVNLDGTRLYVTGYDTGLVAVIDTARLEVVAEVVVGSQPDGMVLSPDGQRLYVTNDQDGTVTIVDTATNAVVGTFDAGDTGSAIAISADGTRLYIPQFGTGALSVVTVNPAAQPPTGALRGQGVQVVYFRNLTEKPVTFTGLKDPLGVVASPKPGTVIPPGGYVTISMSSQFFPPTHTRVSLQTGQPGDADFARFAATLFAGLVRCQGDGGRGSCSGIDDHTVALLPPPGSTVVVNAGDPATQAAILVALCRSGSSCHFVANRQEETFTPSRLVSYTTLNNTTVDQVTKIIVVDTETQSDSISVSAKVGGAIAKVVNVEITATYGHTWTYTHTFQKEFDLTIPPGQRLGVYASQPVYRVYGDFTVEFNGVTYQLNDTYFDTPNPNGVSNYEISPVTLPEDVTSVDALVTQV